MWPVTWVTNGVVGPGQNSTPQGIKRRLEAISRPCFPRTPFKDSIPHDYPIVILQDKAKLVLDVAWSMNHAQGMMADLDDITCIKSPVGVQYQSLGMRSGMGQKGNI
jgi:hypothetical protein